MPKLVRKRFLFISGEKNWKNWKHKTINHKQYTKDLKAYIIIKFNSFFRIKKYWIDYFTSYILELFHFSNLACRIITSNVVRNHLWSYAHLTVDFCSYFVRQTHKNSFWHFTFFAPYSNFLGKQLEQTSLYVWRKS